MKGKKHLYIRLTNPNNIYSNGELVFESSLNKSANFRIFVMNKEFAEFRNKVYLEIEAEQSETRKWLVSRLRLRAVATDAATLEAFRHKAAEEAGCDIEMFATLSAADAWERLCRLTLSFLPYAKIWTDHQYLPTEPEKEPGLRCTHDEGNQSWSISENVAFADPEFEIARDEWGRQVFRFRPDRSGYPPVMECLLSDLQHFLSKNNFYPGSWLLDNLSE